VLPGGLLAGLVSAGWPVSVSGAGVVEQVLAVASADDDAGGLITGIAAAAGYVGYDKPDSFRRARTRHPSPSETRTPDGRPAWTPAAPRDWHAQRDDGNRPAHRDGE
jgi:hypothetical protein